MLSCAKINLLIFLWRIFSKALQGSGRASLLRFDGISCDSLRIGSSRTDLWPELRKESDSLTSWWMLCLGIELLTPKTVELFSLPQEILPLLSALYQSCLLPLNSQTFLVNSIVPNLFKWTLLLFKCYSMSMLSLWSTKVILRWPNMFISWLCTSYALLFRLSFRGTISDIITAFPSDFMDNARLMTDLNIWLAVLLF